MQPPDLPGFEHVRLLGSGGYSDVFLYEQQMPRRQVAIKVLLTEARDEDGRRAFFDEANAMASVSTHPYIVSVFHAEVSAEGHPYLVMEYYPRDNFSVRSRNEQIPVFEALRVGIQVASAVETAHRAGILHRDIKPANILTSEYDRPGLTDFGIATAATGASEAEGMSIPWSPPEVVNGSAPGDATADVYSLAATVHTLLSGRSPFEIPGGSNRTFDLIPRIEAGGPQPTGRADVPDSVERILRHGMSRSAADRPGSAAEFAHLLQACEVELGLAPTQLEIRQDPRDVRARATVEDDDGTRLKGPKVIQSQGTTGPGPGEIVTGAPGGVVPAGAAARHLEQIPAEAGDGTVQRGAAQPAANPGMISGVGARPVGLAGSPGPRPVAPMPSGAEGAGTNTFDPSGFQREGSSSDDGSRRHRATEKREVSWTKLIAGVAVGALVLVGLGAAFSITGDTEQCTPGEPDCPCDPGEPGCDPDPPPPPTFEASAPVSVDVADNPDGSRTLSWKHDGSPEDFTYEVIGTNNEVLGERSVAAGNLVVETGPEDETDADGLTMTTDVVEPDPCLSIRAVPVDPSKWKKSEPSLEAC